MKALKINFKKKLKNEISLIADYFKSDKIIIYPTDTIYGLGCLATDKKAINKIYKIKKREAGKPLLILTSSLAMVKKYCYVSGGQEEYLRKIWGIKIPPAPFIKGGAVTVILKSRGILPKELEGEKGTLAVRLPKNDFLIKIIRKAGASIVSTSANISGEEYSGDIEKIGKLFGKNIDLIIDAGALNNKPSKIVDIRDMNNIGIIRK